MIATAIASLSPLLVYFSANARAYSLMMLFLAGAVLTLLLAAGSGRKWWWVAYAVLIALAAVGYAGMLAYHYGKGGAGERAEEFLFRAGAEAARARFESVLGAALEAGAAGAELVDRGA